MSVVALAVQTITRAGITPTFGAANADGYDLPNNGRTYVEVKNAGASPCIATIASTATLDGLAVADPTVTTPITTGNKKFGPLDVNIFGSTVRITFDQVTSVTIGAFTLA